MKKNLYTLLNVPVGATDEEIKTAYRRLAKLYHPDTQLGAQYADLMSEINAAYDVLQDTKKREAYDIEMGFKSTNDAYKNKMDAGSDADSREKSHSAYENAKAASHENAADFFRKVVFDNEFDKEFFSEIKDELERRTKVKYKRVPYAKGLIITLACTSVFTGIIGAFFSQKLMRDYQRNGDSYKTTIYKEGISFSLGDGIEQLISIMGMPDYVQSDGTCDRYIYGDSYVTIKDSKIVGWDNKGKNLVIYIGKAEEGVKFGLDSSVEELIAAMGTPEKIYNFSVNIDYYYYGSSYAIVKDKRVSGWYSGNVPINVNMGVALSNASFGMNSTMEEVVAAMGTPECLISGVNDDSVTMYYGSSMVSLTQRRVTAWTSGSVALKVR